MLVLSRKSRESVVVLTPDGGSCHLRITVLEIAPGRVRLGFEGGTDVPVHRWEVWQRLLSTQDRPVARDAHSGPADRLTSEESLLAAVIGDVPHSLFQSDHVV